MKSRHRGWRPWLAAAMSTGLAGIATIILGRGAYSSTFFPAPADRAALASAAPVLGAYLPAAVAEQRATEFGPHGRRPGHRALAADANGGQVQLPRPGSAADTRPAAAPESSRPTLILPAWRSLLETRWQQRLSTVTELSLAYHDAAERSGSGHGADSQAQTRQLLHKAVAARHALRNTEEALARLSAGSYGRCEQCAAVIPAGMLFLEPETRYCGRCSRPVLAETEP